MIFSEDFISSVCNEIVSLSKNETLENEEKLSRLEKLMSIYRSIKNIEMVELQSNFMKQSQEAFKNIDFSKIDMSEVFNQFSRK